MWTPPRSHARTIPAGFQLYTPEEVVAGSKRRPLCEADPEEFDAILEEGYRIDAARGFSGRHNPVDDVAWERGYDPYASTEEDMDPRFIYEYGSFVPGDDTEINVP